MKQPYRIMVSLIIGIASGIVCFLYQKTLGWSEGGDFGSELRSLVPLFAGQNPYIVLGETWPLFYPLPTLLLMTPFYYFSLNMAAGIFFGLSSFFLSYQLIKEHPWKLLLFLGFPFWGSLKAAQWSPLMCAIYLTPGLIALSLLKPSLGLAIAATGRWRIRDIVGVVIAVAFSLIIIPTWPFDWFHLLGSHPHAYPLTTISGLISLGILLLYLPALWKERAFWFLIILLFVPQTTFYDTLLLFLLPKTVRGMMVLIIGSWIAYIGWTLGMYAVAADTWVFGWMYIPLAFVFIKERNIKEPIRSIWNHFKIQEMLSSGVKYHFPLHW